jgi:DNA-binding response OmpR family regulator
MKWVSGNYSEILGDEGHVVQLRKTRSRHDWPQEAKPDLVLLDIWMPDTDGVTLLKEWQRDGLLTMPVIMMSGHATIDTAVEATRIGALNFLEKPIALQKLLKAVQQGLTRTPEPVRPAAPALRVISSDHNHPSLTQGGIQASSGTFESRQFNTAPAAASAPQINSPVCRLIYLYAKPETRLNEFILNII